MEPTVTLSLSDFDRMRDGLKEGKKINEELKTKMERTEAKTSFAHKQLGMLLSAMSVLPEFQREVDTFNARSEEATIYVKDGMVTIQIKETTLKET